MKHHADDLFMSPVDQAEIDFENEGGETYICGNPPYLGSTWQKHEQKEDLRSAFSRPHQELEVARLCGRLVHEGRRFWASYQSSAAFVSTNSDLSGAASRPLWPLILETGHEIAFAHTSFQVGEPSQS